MSTLTRLETLALLRQRRISKMNHVVSASPALEFGFYVAVVSGFGALGWLVVRAFVA